MQGIPNRPPALRRFGAMALLAALPFVAAPGSVLGQQPTTGVVRGTVVEAGTGRQLAGAQVYIRGTQRGALADAQGVYQITGVPAGSVTIRVDLIGFRTSEQTTTVAAGQTATLNFQLTQSAIGLDEIVVTGTSGRGQAKRTLGNSVSSVKAEALTEVAPISNVGQLLQGRTPGVTLMQTTGVVGGGSRMRIRGSGSLTSGGNEPVVYVDGVRVQSGQVATQSNTSQPINLLEAFSPSDIESIEVIKGPAAATLYGADAAAGVIQIITKKGRPSEGLQWSLNQEYGEVNWVGSQIVNYWLCTDARINARNSSGVPTNPGCQVFNTSQPLEDRILVDRPLDPSRRSEGVKHQYQQNGWTEDYPCLFPKQAPCQANPLRTGVTRNTNLSVRGGGEAYNFYLSGEKSNQDGTFSNNMNDRMGGRANFGFVPSTKSNFNVNVGYVQLKQQLPESDNSSNSILRNAYRGEAGGLPGQFLPGFKNRHPEFSNKYDRVVDQERVTLGFTGSYSPFSWWQNKLTVGLDSRESVNTLKNDIDQTGGQLWTGNSANGSINIATSKVWLWTADYSGTVSNDLNEDWASNFSAGMQMSRRKAESQSVTGQGFVANNLNLVSAAALRNATQGYSEQTSLGFYVQEQVGYKDRVFGTAAVRIDDNSAFGRDFSLVVYPKASLAWVISEENFFNVGFVDDLKLRGAWGQAGSSPAPFSADRTYQASRAIVGDEAINILVTDSYGNANLKAETGSEIELGFEGSVLRGKIGVDFTYYNKSTKDALLSVTDPPSSGWTGSHLMNVGEINNQGLELAITATPYQSSKVEWDVIASVGTNRNKLVSFGRDENGRAPMHETRTGDFASVQRNREGYPIGGFWATVLDLDANGNPILTGSHTAPEARVKPCDSWDPEFRDQCGERFIGAPFPTHSLGLTNTLRLFRNLQFYAFLDYQGGHYQWCAICYTRTRSDLNSEERNDPRLSPEHAEYETYGRAQLGILRSTQTETYIYKADNLKLRELSTTYSVPRSYIDRFGFSRASFTLSARNLWMWTKYRDGRDPEVNFTGNANTTQSDYGSIPMQRWWSVSMNLNF